MNYFEQKIKELLEQKFHEFNNKKFIFNDPISIPHLFSKKQDIEIMGFFAATLAWGQRKVIIQKCKELIDRMDGEPYNFIINLTDAKLKKLVGFKHRTFNDSDLLYFVNFFHFHYNHYESLEQAFTIESLSNEDWSIEIALNKFKTYFFSFSDFYLKRTEKHISSPQNNSSCKRLCMFLRWMVRKDDKGVDLGLWNSIPPSKLVCPCDIHVVRIAQKIKLINNCNSNWKTAVALTEKLKKFDPHDPTKYDFSLFGLGLEERYKGISPFEFFI